MTSPAHRTLVMHQQASWLPPGGRAEVVLALEDAAPPEPTCLVRVLATRGGAVLTRRRADGRGLDIPTQPVSDDSVEHTLRSVLAGVVTEVGPVRLLGWVRNVVDGPDQGYPWPTPEAYFAVWHCEVAPDSEPEGEWLRPGEAEALLGERHWWPLAAHAGVR